LTTCSKGLHGTPCFRAGEGSPLVGANIRPILLNVPAVRPDVGLIAGDVGLVVHTIAPLGIIVAQIPLVGPQVHPVLRHVGPRLIEHDFRLQG